MLTFEFANQIVVVKNILNQKCIIFVVTNYLPVFLLYYKSLYKKIFLIKSKGASSSVRMGIFAFESKRAGDVCVREAKTHSSHPNWQLSAN